MSVPTVLDACCGSRMFWFDPKDERAVFIDKRRETHDLKDSSSKGGVRSLVIDPDNRPLSRDELQALLTVVA